MGIPTPLTVHCIPKFSKGHKGSTDQQANRHRKRNAILGPAAHTLHGVIFEETHTIGVQTINILGISYALSMDITRYCTP